MKALELKGKKFGKLLVLERVQGDSRPIKWLCLCDCGRTTTVAGGHLNSGHTRTCGCFQRSLELVPGQRFGKLTVVERQKNNAHGAAMWLCLCDCGNTTVVISGHLNNNTTRSCGCFAREATSIRNRTHGMSGKHLYQVWANMWRRCYEITNEAFYDYGGRGIKVCKEWLIFENFYAWAEPLYSRGLYLDRINNDGDYEPGNCRFTTRSVNNANQRKRKSKLGLIGVYSHDSGFQARVSYKNKVQHLGTFNTIREAVEARNAYIIKHSLPHKLQEV